MAGIRRFLLRLVCVFRRRGAERELAREIEAHLHLLEDRFVAGGMSVDEARRAARRAFGGVEQAKEAQRDARFFRWLDNSWVDLRLGVRVLVKDPGLTLAGGLGIAVAIAIAAGAFAFIRTMADPDLSLDEGERIVSLQVRDLVTNKRERKILRDFVEWRQDLASITDLTAFRNIGRNLIAPGKAPDIVAVAEMNASGFRVARVPPLLGRYLLESDEQASAPHVVVLGYDAWRTLLASDPAVVGRSIRLGHTVHTVVGVMPDGFRFPLNNAVWVPLRFNAAEYERRQGPGLYVFGRLAPNATIESARAELSIIGRRASAAFPATHERLRPDVLPYAHPFVDMDDPEAGLAVQLARFLVVLLLVLVSVNVAILVYARTARRRAEIAIRTALGATRRRIVVQLFLEATVLSAVSAAVGLVLARIGLDQVNAALPDHRQLPFWMTFGLSRGAVLYVMTLAVLAAGIIGVVPALKATGRRVQPGLAGAGTGGTNMQMGRTWTTLIVAQVAVAVALLPAAIWQSWNALRYGIVDAGVASAHVLTARLTFEQGDLALERAVSSNVDSISGDPELVSRYHDRETELVRRLKTEPGIDAVTFALAVPGQEPTVWIEADGLATPAQSEAEASDFAVRSGKFGHEVRFNRVDIGFFDAFGVSLLAGRRFTSGDLANGDVVLVNRTLAERLGGTGRILGRRLRYVGRSVDARPEDIEMRRWYEMVGVVSDFPARPAGSEFVDAKIYHPASPGTYPLSLAFRVRGSDPARVAGRVRELTAAVDPDLQLREMATLDAVLREEQGVMRLLAAGLALITLSVVLLSSAGIYALMSFTVTQRRKEVAIRAALGADARRLLAGIFSRALGQLGVGAAVGMLAAAGLDRLTGGDLLHGHAVLVLPLVAVFMTVVGLLAALGPARRGLRIQPTEALRAE